MFTKEKIKPENSLLQPHKESTLEKQQRLRLERRAALAFCGRYHQRTVQSLP